MILPITLTTAAAAAIITLWLMIRIARLRAAHKVMHGDGGIALLARRMRAQLNFIETAPIVLALIAAIELSGKGGTWLMWVSAAYIVGRILHPLGLDREDANAFRAIGVLLTMLTLIGLAVVAVLITYGVM